MNRRTVRPALVLAFAWLLASVVLTMLLAPGLGARGLLWLGFYNLLCLIGSGWEIRRAWRVQRKLTGTPAEE